MLAAIVPREDQTWFFKAVGPGAVLAGYKADFDKFLASVKFVDGDSCLGSETVELRKLRLPSGS